MRGHSRVRRLGSVVAAVAIAGIAALAAPAQAQTGPQPGGVFVTGHDPDFHVLEPGANNAGASNILQRAVEYVTHNASDPSLLLVTSRAGYCSVCIDSVAGLEAIGYSGFDVADDGSAGGSVLDVDTVDFNSYDVVVVASDFGGSLTQAELDGLNARAGDLLDYVNEGGGLVALAESGDGGGGSTAHDRYGFLPFLVTSTSFTRAEFDNQVTPEGAALGLSNDDINGNFSHLVFTGTGGMDVIDVTPDGYALSLATRLPVTPGGVDDPPTLELPGDIIVEATGPSGATVSYEATATDEEDGSVEVTCEPASGSTFPVGTTTVHCSATDSAGNSATGEFTVQVTSAVPHSAAECKKGGWQHLTDDLGRPFKNQGDCVSYVATGGRNKAAG